MRAAVYYSNRDVRIEEVPAPSAGTGEIVIRIEASGVCGSDVMEWYRAPRAPLVLGHEVAGEVVEVGEGVAAFAEGDRVVTTHHVPCGACRYCLSDRHPYCETLRTTHFDPGGFCERVRVPAIHVERGTLRIPDGVSFEAASFVEPLACAVRALRVARFERGHTVAVLGSGISGALFLQLTRALGARRILATDVHPFRLDAALRLGADAAMGAASENVPARIRELNEGRGADTVIVTTAAPEAIAQGFRSADRGGTVLLFALAPPGRTLAFPLYDLWRDGVSIVHSYAGPPADMRAALDLIAARRVDVAATITHRLPLAETGRAFALVEAAAESLKVLVEPQR